MINRSVLADTVSSHVVRQQPDSCFIRYLRTIQPVRTSGANWPASKLCSRAKEVPLPPCWPAISYLRCWGILGALSARALRAPGVGATGNENSDRNSTRITIDHGRPGGPLNRGRPGAPNVLPRPALHTGCQHLRLGPICIACSRVLGQRGLSRNRAIYLAIKRAGNQVSSMSGRGLMELL